MSLHSPTPRTRAAIVLGAVLFTLVALSATPALAATTWANPVPAPGTAVEVTNPKITIDALDPVGLYAGGFSIKVDGVNKKTKSSSSVIPGGRRLTCLPGTLANGSHSVYVSWLNLQGKSSSYTWTFVIGSQPKLTDQAPAADSVVTTTTPLVSVRYTDASPDPPAAVTLQVDGIDVPTSYDPGSRTLSGRSHALVNDRSHHAWITVTNSAGLSVQLAWDFQVQVFTEMPGVDCGACHPSAPSAHMFEDCLSCHFTGGPYPDCQSCHYWPHGPEVLTPATCASCHNRNNAASFPFHDDGATDHQSALDDTCNTCHVRSLTTEHFRRTDDMGIPLTCATCHGSTDTAVSNAIALGDTACASCHILAEEHPYGDVDHVADVEALEDISGKTCGDCHQMDLATEHGKPTSSSAGRGCDLCHPAPRNTFSAWSDSCEQGGCHAADSPTAKHGAMPAAHTRLAANDSCFVAGCHADADVASIHDGALAPDGRTSCSICHSSSGTPTKDCAGCHTAQGVDYHRDMAVHYAPDSYESCGHCHHGWGSSPIRGPDVLRHEGGCATCHNGTINTEGITTACANCHATEGAGTPPEAYHRETELVHSPLDEGSLGCADCHETTDVRELHAAPGCETCHATYSCVECHMMHNGQPGTPLLSGLSCSNCHTTVGVDYHRSFETSHTFSAMDAGCQSEGCHTNALVDAHQSYVGEGNRYPQYSDTCGLCHKNEDPERIPDEATADCSGCHEPHGDLGAVHTAPAGSCVIAGCHVGNVMTLHQTPGCSSCHGAGKTASLVCSSCHSNPQHAGTDHKTTETCDACHANGNVAVYDGVTYTYPQGDLTSIHGDDCAACHAQPALATVIANWDGTCAQVGCHPGPHPNTYGDSWHPGGHGDGDACWDCHEDEAMGCAGPNSCHPHAYEREAPVTTSSAVASYSSVAYITLTPTDVGQSGVISGIRATYYQVDGGAVQIGTSVLVVGPASGTAYHTLEFWSADNNLNTEAHHLVSFSIEAGGPDMSPPTGTMSVNSGASYTNATAATLDSSGVTDGETGVVSMRIDPGGGSYGAWVPYSASYPITLPAGNGTKTVRAEYQDVGGNVLALTDTIVLDAAAPTGTMSVNNGAAWTNSTAVTVNSSVSDALSGVVQMRVNPGSGSYGAWVPYSSALPITMPGTSGTRYVYAQYRDGAGNVLTLSDTITLDPYSPTGTMSINNGAASTASTAVTVNSSMSDSSSGMNQMRVDPGTGAYGSWVAYAASHPITLPAGDGIKTVNVQYTDRAGNTATKTDTIELNTGAGDTTAPTTTSNAQASYTGPATIQLTATDNPGGSGVAHTYYKLDSGTQTEGGSVSVPAPSSGSQAHTLEFWSEDVAGNVETPHKTVSFTVNAGVATGRIDLAWWAPDGSWAYYWVYDADNNLVSSGYDETSSGWDGWFHITVPVDSRPYRFDSTWYDSDWGEEGSTSGSALIDTPGKVVTIWY